MRNFRTFVIMLVCCGLLQQILGKTDSPAKSFGISITDWVGKKFIVLPKQALVRHFGYELYLTPALENNKKLIDLDWETAQHHVKCEKLSGCVISVKKILLVCKEYLITFEHEQSGATLYAKTRGGSLEGIALALDLDIAKSLWLGKKIYSVRRFIDTFDSASGALGNIKVKIEQPLLVTGIVWGMTPLPPKPIWVKVKTDSGETGFIPTRTSWTNTLTVKKSGAAPWDEDILDSDPKKLFGWDEGIFEIINSHSIAMRMTRSQVRMSWGQPLSIITMRSKTTETWAYADQNLVFENDSLVASKNK